MGAAAVKSPIFQFNIVVCARLNCRAARSQIANSIAAPGPIALRLSLGAGLSANLLLLFFPDEKALLVHPRRYRYVEEAHHHFAVGLLAPAHFCIPVRILPVPLPIALPPARFNFHPRSY